MRSARFDHCTFLLVTTLKGAYVNEETTKPAYVATPGDVIDAAEAVVAAAEALLKLPVWARGHDDALRAALKVYNCERDALDGAE